MCGCQYALDGVSKSFVCSSTRRVVLFVHLRGVRVPTFLRVLSVSRGFSLSAISSVRAIRVIRGSQRKVPGAEFRVRGFAG